MKEEQNFKEKWEIKNDKDLLDEVERMESYMAYIKYNNKKPSVDFISLYDSLVFEIKRKKDNN